VRVPRLNGVEFLCYHRDRVGSGLLRDARLEQHWSYMDRYAQQMIARGPMLTPDGRHATGSIHALDLPDHAAARAFAFEEYWRAGIFRDVLLRRWQNCSAARCGTSPQGAAKTCSRPTGPGRTAASVADVRISAATSPPSSPSTARLT
jgi:uncharacterized protein